jgi:hypothetical protein
MDKPQTRPVHLRHPLPANAGPFAGDADPGDSERLRRLREIIDTELGWANQADEEAGDYEARLREVARELRTYRLTCALARMPRVSTARLLADFDRAARAAREREEQRG